MFTNTILDMNSSEDKVEVMAKLKAKASGKGKEVVVKQEKGIKNREVVIKQEKGVGFHSSCVKLSLVLSYLHYQFVYSLFVHLVVVVHFWKLNTSVLYCILRCKYLFISFSHSLLILYLDLFIV